MILGLVWPTLAMAALVFVRWAIALATRRDERSADLSVLFFALVPLLMLTAQVSHAQVVLAWLVVAASAADIMVVAAGARRWLRLVTAVVSGALLAAMWVGFAVDVRDAARGYEAAATMAPAQP